MDWKICAQDDLRRYRQMKVGVINSRARLATITSEARSARNSLRRRKRTDTQLVNVIVESERLKNNIKTAETLCKLIERGLEVLSEHEKRALEAFYMSDLPPNMVQLKEELGYETRTVYRIRDRALEKFTLAMYGIEIL